MNVIFPASARLVGSLQMDYALLLPAKAPIRMHDTLPDLVARSALMRGTSDAALSLLKRARLSLRILAAGEIVFRTGDAAEAVYLLLGARTNADGLDVDPLVQVELKPATGKRLLRFERIVHGEIFGELEFLEQGMLPKGARRTTSAFALTPASVVPLPLPLFAELIEADGMLRSRVIRIGSQRLVAALMQQHEKVHTFPDLLLADWLVELSADIGIAEGTRIDEPVERRLQPRTHRTRGMAPERDGSRLEARAVMTFEQPGREQRHRMIAEIGRQIGEANTRMRIGLALPERRRRIGQLVLDVSASTAELEIRIGRTGHEMEWQ